MLKKISNYDYILIAVLDGLMGMDIKRKLEEKYSLNIATVVAHVSLLLVNFIEI